MARGRNTEERIQSEIRSAASDASALLDELSATPELGFFEFETSRRLAVALRRLGYEVEEGIARTGLRATLRGGQARPCVAFIAELDALRVPEHPSAREGVAHACGHHAQLATLYLIAAGLRSVASDLDGSVAFLAVPAEEFVDLERRLDLRSSGEIEFLSGKAEFIRLGVFAEIDAAILVHATTRATEGRLAVGGRMNGMVAIQVRYLGRAAHAAAAPHLGINALAAAQVAFAALNAAREAVRDEDHVRFNAIITNGGSSPNVIPDDVRVEALVRAASAPALVIARRQALRAFRAGALAIGAGCVIGTIPGYLPLSQDPNLSAVFRAQASRLLGKDAPQPGEDRSGSTDFGDLGHLIPVVQPWAGGMGGSLHGSDFAVRDPDTAVVLPALVTALTIAQLLREDAVLASSIVEAFHPTMTPAEYLAYLRAGYEEDRIEMGEFPY